MEQHSAHLHSELQSGSSENKEEVVVAAIIGSPGSYHSHIRKPAA
jgi:hypothetical protein